MAEEEKPYVSYHERVAQNRLKAEENVFNKKRTVSMPLNPEKIQIAEETYLLIDNAQFKKYIWWESLELGDLYRTAFSHKHPNKELTHGEQMAYNEGLIEGAKSMKGKRESLWNSYLEYLKQKKGEKNENQES